MTDTTADGDGHVVSGRVRVAEPPRPRRLVQMQGDDLVPFEASLRPPVLREGVILRGELVDMLREQAGVPVVVVTGPPGYGKTTLLAQWAGEDSRPFIWLTVDHTSNNPVNFVTYLMLALQRLGDVDKVALESLGEREGVSNVLLPRLGAIVASQERPFVLVVDDAGSLTSRSAVSVLMTVANHLPAGSQLVICGRTVPRLPLSRLRAERRLVNVGPDKLQFSATEAAATLAAANVDASPDEVATLLVHTEGWPAALYLSSLALGRASQQRRELIRSSTHDEVIADYLREMVLAILPLDEQRFLIRTSILTRMSGPLCDAVLATSGSGETLRELAQRNVFVIPLDNHAQWYRYHGMFRDMLRQLAAQQDSQTLVTLHARASRWLEAAGDYAEAIDHARLALQVVRAAHLIWSQAPALLASGGSETLRHWLGGFTSEQVISHAELALTAAWCALESGRPVDHWIEAAERGVFDATEPGEAMSIDAAIALLHAQRGGKDLAGLREEADRALRLQAADDLWRPYAQYLHAATALMMGLHDEARARLTATERLAAVLGLPAHGALCSAQLAALDIESANWDSAGSFADAASSTIVDAGIGDSPIISLVHCVMTVVLAKRRQADDAKRLARRCMRMVAVADQCPPWMAVQTRYLLARAHLLLGDTAAARVLLSEAQSFMRGTPDAVWLRDRLDDAWTHVEQFPLATGVGPSALTSAELRVLQLLPTHLSFEQIGKRLRISRNTVKTQAIATYRKLGVSSRGEAVKRARSLGMIQL